ncbi:MAG: deoxyribose-phosphate aldolase [Spirochaetaceae bacterium]|nr:deoxyribose-phosphate aldolase [Spirochaetaceae bacterium]
MPKDWSKASLAKAIEHSLLKAFATEAQVREHCAEAKKFGFAAVCVNPVWVALCARELASSGIRVCAVVGYPLGASVSEIKAAEAKLAVAQGAQEIDAVINIGAAKAGDWRLVEEDLRAVVKASGEATVRAVLETCYLTDNEKAKACEAALRAGNRCVMTSTGFGTGGATVEDVKLMKRVVGDKIQVKASGGIRTHHDAILMLDAGADRIGASAGIAIVSELPE